MSHKYDYPVQMASIKKNDWRLRKLIDNGLSNEELQKAEDKLWKRIKEIANNAKNPPNHNTTFPGSNLIGHGWEWAVYKLPSNNNVVKVPAGVFREVSEKEYLENSKFAYKICKKYLGDYVLNTKFKRIQTINGSLNTIIQKQIIGDQIDFLIPTKLDALLKQNLITLGKSLLKMSEKEQWLPDFHLWRKEKDGIRGWNVWNMIIVDKKPVVFDFTAYWDVWRLYPQKTSGVVEIKGNNWREFINELSK